MPSNTFLDGMLTWYLVDESSVKNPYFKEELEENKYLIYG